MEARPSEAKRREARRGKARRKARGTTREARRATRARLDARGEGKATRPSEAIKRGDQARASAATREARRAPIASVPAHGIAKRRSAAFTDARGATHSSSERSNRAPASAPHRRRPPGARNTLYARYNARQASDARAGRSKSTLGLRKRYTGTTEKSGAGGRPRGRPRGRPSLAQPGPRFARLRSDSRRLRPQSAIHCVESAKSGRSSTEFGAIPVVGTQERACKSAPNVASKFLFPTDMPRPNRDQDARTLW